MKNSRVASELDTSKNMLEICERAYNILLVTIFRACSFINFACHAATAIQMNNYCGMW